MIAVTISTYERPDLIGTCLETVLANDVLPEEVIVVDQSRDDRTRQIVESFESDLLRYEHHWPPSISGARNRAIELARAEYVAIVDDDCEMPSDWIARLHSEIEHFDHPDALYGEIRDPEPPDPKRLWVSILEPENRIVWTYPAHPGYMGYGAHMILRRAAFEAVGGFDEHLGPGTALGAAEDIDLNYRLLKEGYRAVTTPEAWVYHRQWRPQGGLPNDLRRRCFGQAAFCAKHLREGDRYAARIFAEQVVGDARMFASGFRRRSRLRARAGLARSAGSWTGLLAGWRAYRPDRPGGESP